MKWNKNASVALWNCEGTYYSLLIESLQDDLTFSSFLLLLSSYRLFFRGKTLTTDMLHTNPWIYQNILLKSNVGDPPFAIDEAFMEKIRNGFGIVSTKDYPDDILSVLRDIDSNKECLIINIDEYYYKQSEQFYKQRHNKHSLLIKEVYPNIEEVSAYDSETAQNYCLSYEEISAMFHQSIYRHKGIIKIDFSNHTNNTIFSRDFAPNLSNVMETSCLELFLKRMFEDLSISHCAYYALQGYRYAVLFKIIPYIKMRVIFMQRSAAPQLAVLAVNSEELWQQFHSAIYMQVLRKQISLNSIKQSIENVIAKERELLMRYNMN